MSKPRGRVRATCLHAMALAVGLLALAASTAAHGAAVETRSYRAIATLLEPFGISGETLRGGGLARKWRTITRALVTEHRILAGCREDLDSCPPAAQRFLALIDKALTRDDARARIAEINRAINLTIRPVDDLTQYGVEEFWASPLTTFAAGAGDCEDYAIAKYAALREMGVAADDLRLVVVHDRDARDFHAVAAVRHEGRWLILDNRTLAIRDDSEIAHFNPLFVLDASSVKRLVAAPAKAPAPAPEIRRVAEIASEPQSAPTFSGSSTPYLL